MSFRFLFSGLASAAALLFIGFDDAARADQEPGPAAEFITLGTGGGPVIRRERSEPANALRVGSSVYLFDIGAGTQRRLVEAGIRPGQVKAIFLSHLHIDHTGDLGPFLLNRWVLSDFRKLTIYGPRGTIATLGGISAMSEPIRLAPVTIGGPAKPAFSSTARGVEIPLAMQRPTLVYHDENVRVTAVPNAHYNFAPGSKEARYARSYAFRIEAGGRSFVYSGDSGMSDRLVELARGADVLVTEVIDMAGTEATLRRSGTVPDNVLPSLLAHMQHDHLTPQQIGELAQRAGVKKVVLTHLVPGNDGEADLSPYTRSIADQFKGQLVVARDLDRF